MNENETPTESGIAGNAAQLQRVQADALFGSAISNDANLASADDSPVEAQVGAAQFEPTAQVGAEMGAQSPDASQKPQTQGSASEAQDAEIGNFGPQDAEAKNSRPQSAEAGNSDSRPAEAGNLDSQGAATGETEAQDAEAGETEPQGAATAEAGPESIEDLPVFSLEPPADPALQRSAQDRLDDSATIANAEEFPQGGEEAPTAMPGLGVEDEAALLAALNAFGEAGRSSDSDSAQGDSREQQPADLAEAPLAAGGDFEADVDPAAAELQAQAESGTTHQPEQAEGDFVFSLEPPPDPAIQAVAASALASFLDNAQRSEQGGANAPAALAADESASLYDIEVDFPEAADKTASEPVQTSADKPVADGEGVPVETEDGIAAEHVDEEAVEADGADEGENATDDDADADEAEGNANEENEENEDLDDEDDEDLDVDEEDDDEEDDDEDDLDPHIFMQNRELSWLTFNERVLDQGADESVPLLERLNFISIFWSNLQEFFMVRVGSLTDLSYIDPPVVDSKTGMTAVEQIKAIHERCRELYPIQESYYEHVRGSLAKEGVRHLRPDDLSDEQRNYLSGFVKFNVEPFLSPQIINPQHPFPHLENGKLYILVRLDDGSGAADGKKKGKKGKKAKEAKKGGAQGVVLGLIPLPHQCERIIKLPGRGFQFILLEHAIEMFAPEIFSMYKIKHTNVVCVTRNADIDANQTGDEQDEDYREHMKRLLKQRARLAPVRLECERPLSPVVEKMMLKKLGLKRGQVYDTIVPLDLSFTWGLGDHLSEKKRAKLSNPPFTPAWPAEFKRTGRIMDQIGERDILLSYPYESMDPFVQLLKEAAVDPDVISIKITLYRLASQSQLAEALIAAAENGKEVMALFELRARFDESNNIEWSQRFEQAGCHVIYGFHDYKVHSKICCITRRTPEGVKHITQLGTGNYNEKTAKLYTDLSFITTDEAFGQDAVRFFRNMLLENVSDEYEVLRVAPLQIKPMILDNLDEQIRLARAGKPCGAFLKANSITDKDVIEKIAEASQAGVNVTLFVRGICCLVPEVKGATDNVRVVSIVGRLLEHSRIYCFGTPDDCTIYLSSADLMTRNLNKRVEIAWPIHSERIRNDILEYIDVCLHDTAKLRELRPNATYTPLGAFCDLDEEGNSQPAFDAQTFLIDRSARIAEQAQNADAAAQEQAAKAKEGERVNDLVAEMDAELESMVKQGDDAQVVQEAAAAAQPEKEVAAATQPEQAAAPAVLPVAAADVAQPMAETVAAAVVEEPLADAVAAADVAQPMAETVAAAVVEEPLVDAVVAADAVESADGAAETVDDAQPAADAVAAADVVEPAADDVAAAADVVEPVVDDVAAAADVVEPLADAPEPQAIAPEPQAIAPEPQAVAPEPQAIAPEPQADAPELAADSAEPQADALEFPMLETPEIEPSLTDMPLEDLFGETMHVAQPASSEQQIAQQPVAQEFAQAAAEPMEQPIQQLVKQPADQPPLQQENIEFAQTTQASTDMQQVQPQAMSADMQAAQVPMDALQAQPQPQAGAFVQQPLQAQPQANVQQPLVDAQLQPQMQLQPQAGVDVQLPQNPQIQPNVQPEQLAQLQQQAMPVQDPALIQQQALPGQDPAQQMQQGTPPQGPAMTMQQGTPVVTMGSGMPMGDTQFAPPPASAPAPAPDGSQQPPQQPVNFFDDSQRDIEMPPQKKGFFARLFGKKD